MKISTHAGNRYSIRCGFKDVFEADRTLRERLSGEVVELTYDAARELYGVTRDKHAITKGRARFLEFYEPNIREHVLAILVGSDVVTIYTQEMHSKIHIKTTKKEETTYAGRHRKHTSEFTAGTGLPD